MCVFGGLVQRIIGLIGLMSRHFLIESVKTGPLAFVY